MLQDTTVLLDLLHQSTVQLVSIPTPLAVHHVCHVLRVIIAHWQQVSPCHALKATTVVQALLLRLPIRVLLGHITMRLA